jgi:hypothetical protein
VNTSILDAFACLVTISSGVVQHHLTCTEFPVNDLGLEGPADAGPSFAARGSNRIG